MDSSQPIESPVTSVTMATTSSQPMETSVTTEETTVTREMTLTSTVTRITFSSRPSEFVSGLESLSEMVREIGQQIEFTPALQFEEFSKQEDKLKVR